MVWAVRRQRQKGRMLCGMSRAEAEGGEWVVYGGACLDTAESGNTIAATCFEEMQFLMREGNVLVCSSANADSSRPASGAPLELMMHVTRG